MSTLNKVSRVKSEDVAAVSASVSELVSAKTVLIVEDDLCCSISLQLMLESYGCEVLSADFCAMALALLRQNQETIDLILLDVMMPDKTGIDFLIETKSQGLLAGIPVVIQSAESKETIQKALDNGACGYIQKPYSTASIFNLVADLSMKRMSKYHHSKLGVCV